jgi:hypothetical protein
MPVRDFYDHTQSWCWPRCHIFTTTPDNNTLLCNNLVSRCLVSRTLDNNTLLCNNLVSRCLVSTTLDNKTPFHNKLVSRCLVSRTLDNKTPFCNNLLSRCLVSTTLDNNTRRGYLRPKMVHDVCFLSCHSVRRATCLNLSTCSGSLLSQHQFEASLGPI